MSKLYDIIDNAQVTSHYDEAAQKAVKEIKDMFLEMIKLYGGRGNDGLIKKVSEL